MRPDSQDPMLSQKTHTTTMVDKKRSVPFKTPSQPKRARLDITQQNKENKQDVGGRDEMALMDDLMAGLDASMFDGAASSPVKSHSLSQVVRSRDSPVKRQRQVSPLRPKTSMARQVSPERQRIKIERSPLRPTLPIPTNRQTAVPTIPRGFHESPIKAEPKRVKAFLPIKIELEPEIPLSVVHDIKDVKQVLEDEEDEFTFDFNLDELAGMDDDMLLKPHVEAKVRSTPSDIILC